jgi:RNA polymerase sigma factor (sigma-70 family)
MATNQLKRIIQTLRGATLHPDEAGLTDGQLLENYIRSREEAAFAALVQRHGPMVWGVCRRVLRGHQDAEDAFQATFLVLVRKAASVVSKDLVANYLYGVAHQTALKARATTAKRGAREKQVTVMPEPTLEQREPSDDLQAMLDQELSRLPDKYRAVIVLCDLEGKTRKEAAQHFNLPEGTVASRLATARTMLAKRLARAGLAVPAGALVAVLSSNEASASVPVAVASSTIRAASLFAAGQTAAPGVISAKAARLAEGVLWTMLLTKLKIATAGLVVVMFLVVAAAALAQQVLSEKPAAQPVAEKKELVNEPVQQPLKEKKEQAQQPVKVTKETADQPVKEKKATEAVPSVVSGVAQAVDAEQNTLIVAHRDGVNTFTVAKDAKIEIDGKPGALAGIPPGANVTLSKFVDATTATSIRAEGRSLWGVVVSAVDAASNTITLEDNDFNKQRDVAGKTFSVAKGANISVDGKPGKLAAIPKGASVNLGLCADQQTARNVEAAGATFNGVAKAVDAASNTITVDDKTYAVAANAYIGIDHKPGKLAGIPPGTNVQLTLHVDQQTVGRITANGPSYFGNVKAVDTEKNTITVTGNREDRTFSVPPGTYIVIDGKQAKLGQIPKGAYLHALNLCVDQQTASGINVIGPGFHHVQVKTVDAENNTISFDDKAPAELAGKTLPVAQDAHITIDGKNGKLNAVPPGCFVNLGLSADQTTARNIAAEGPNLGGCGGSCVKAVDAEKNTITFDDKGPSDVAGKTFTVAPGANIAIDGRPGKLASLPPGSYVNLTLSVDQQTVRSIGAQGPRLSGVVKAVDTEKNTITVDDITYMVTKDTTIVIDGKVGPLAGLPTGVTVNVNLRVDQRTIGMIQTKTP